MKGLENYINVLHFLSAVLGAIKDYSIRHEIKGGINFETKKMKYFLHLLVVLKFH